MFNVHDSVKSRLMFRWTVKCYSSSCTQLRTTGCIWDHTVLPATRHRWTTPHL